MPAAYQGQRSAPWHHRTMTEPPNGLPRYRLLTGPDDEAFCRRVSEALDLGYELYGDPAISLDGGRAVVAQAVVWHRVVRYV